jgi:hypothetical protein
MMLDAANIVQTRAISSLVDANEGTFLNVAGATPTVMLGSAAGDAANPLTAARTVSLGGQTLTFDQGAGGTGTLQLALEMLRLLRST